MSCPICDAIKINLDVIDAFVMGCGMGAEFGMNETGAMLCEPHREAAVVSMKKQTALLNQEVGN